MAKGKVPAEWPVPGNRHTVAERLHWAIYHVQGRDGRQRGLRLFQRRMEARAEGDEALVGYHLSSIQGYINGEVEPSRHFLEAASQVLGVRLEWLLLGQGEPTPEEQEAKEAEERQHLIQHDPGFIESTFANGLPGYESMSRTARAALLDLWVVLSAGTDISEEVERDGQLVLTRGQRTARRIVQAVSCGPLEALQEEIGPRIDGAAFSHYVVHACQALRQYTEQCRAPAEEEES